MIYGDFSDVVLELPSTLETLALPRCPVSAPACSRIAQHLVKLKSLTLAQTSDDEWLQLGGSGLERLVLVQSRCSLCMALADLPALTTLETVGALQTFDRARLRKMLPKLNFIVR
jgi:hypothetical protein